MLNENRSTADWQLVGVLGNIVSDGGGLCRAPVLLSEIDLSRYFPSMSEWSIGSKSMVPRATFDFGGLGGLSPITNDWGYSRGLPVDRVYIERFLARHKHDIRGHVLEIGDDTYTWRFGEERVAKSTTLDIRRDNSKAMIVADLTDAPHIPDDTFDCVILTQVLVLIRDFESALRTVSRILKPHGVALITIPGITQISADTAESAAWSWSFYPETFRSFVSRYFDRQNLIVESYGNVKTTIAFLAGLARDDLAPDDFEHNDCRYPLIVGVRAIK
jgi:SAM-dependent methyltransferase